MNFFFFFVSSQPKEKTFIIIGTHTTKKNERKLIDEIVNDMKKTTMTTKKRKSSRPSPDDDDDDDERNEAELPPARLSKEALIEKFKNFDDIEGPKVVGGGKRTTAAAAEEANTRELPSADGGIEDELKMDFNKVPEILRDFERNATDVGDDDGMFSSSSSSDAEEDVLEKKKEGDNNENDGHDISFEDKLLSNAADDSSGKLRMRADISLTEGEYAGKSTSRAKMFAEEEEELRKDHYFDSEDDYEEQEEEDIDNGNKGRTEKEEEEEEEEAYSDNSEEEEEDDVNVDAKKKKKKEGRRRNEYDNFSDEDDDDGEEEKEKEEGNGGDWNIYDDGDEEMRAVLDSANRKKGKRRKSDKEAAKMFKKFEAELPRLNISDDEEEEDEEDREDDDDNDAMEEDSDDDNELGGRGGGGGGRDDREEDDDDDDDDNDDDDDDFDYAGAMEKDDTNRSNMKQASARDEEYGNDDDDAIEDAADLKLEEELKKFELEEQEMKRLSEQKAKTEQKSKSVRIQRALWEQMLRMRIKLQNGIENGMKMPGPLANRGLRRLSKSTNKSLESLATAAKDTLLAMLHLQLYLMKQFEKTGEVDTSEVAAKLKNLKQKREDEKSEGEGGSASTEQFWDVCEAIQNEFVEFRDSSCDRWQRKSQVSSGSAGNLKAFNQGISQQVRAAMLAPEKAIDRSRPALARTKKIGENIQVSRLGDSTNSDNSDDERFDEDVDGARPNKNGSSMESRKDIESYDDFDMYEQLLKEFLESGNVDGDAPRNAAKPAKRRKIVDRRASKGRKLRYHIQEPLVNFVSSIEEEVPQWAEKLFTQLFASKG